MSDMPQEPPISRSVEPALVRRHLLWGWAALLVFLLLGAVLEVLHALKMPLYLNAENETRRLLWRLAHAHGALLALLQVGAAWTLSWLDQAGVSVPARLISRCLLMALLTLPLGFFVGGIGASDGDPGIGIVLVPAGTVFLTAAVLLFIRALWRKS